MTDPSEICRNLAAQFRKFLSSSLEDPEAKPPKSLIEGFDRIRFQSKWEEFFNDTTWDLEHLSFEETARVIERLEILAEAMMPRKAPATSGKEPPSQASNTEQLEIALVWDENEGVLTIGDTDLKVVREIQIGALEWAILSVLHADRDTELEIETLGQQVDLLIVEHDAKIAAEANAKAELQAEVETDHTFTASQIRRSASRRRPTYKDEPPDKLKDRFQAILRKNRTPEAKSWQRRWIHWKKNTVYFGLEENR